MFSILWCNRLKWPRHLHHPCLFGSSVVPGLALRSASISITFDHLRLSSSITDAAVDHPASHPDLDWRSAAFDRSFGRSTCGALGKRSADLLAWCDRRPAHDGTVSDCDRPPAHDGTVGDLCRSPVTSSTGYRHYGISWDAHGGHTWDAVRSPLDLSATDTEAECLGHCDGCNDASHQ